MPQFNVDDDLATLVERLAKQKPFENLSFNDALRRVLNGRIHTATNGKVKDKELDALLAESMALYRNRMSKKAPTPSASDWVATVPELSGKKGLDTWRAICDTLKIDTAGDSARRRLSNWVKSNRPTWPTVPQV